MEFNIGDKALCVEAFDGIEEGETAPQVGEVYTVRNFHNHEFMRLKEIVNPEFEYKDGGLGEAAFACDHFIKWNPEEEIIKLEKKEEATV